MHVCTAILYWVLCMCLMYHTAVLESVYFVSTQHWYNVMAVLYAADVHCNSCTAIQVCPEFALIDAARSEWLTNGCTSLQVT